MGCELAMIEVLDSVDISTADFSSDDCPVYRRYNGSGMTSLIRAMRRYGMSYESGPLGEQPSEDLDDPATLKWLTVVDNPQQGFPDHKVCSNSGWIVTRDECESALKQWGLWCKNAGISSRRELPASARTRAWRNWISWLEVGASTAGFQVC
jgi:hypothetical protein